MSLFAELKRRNVFRVAVAYAVAGWLATEVASVVLPTFGAPEWVLKVLIALFFIGFPITLIFAWVYEITPEGVKLEHEVDRSTSITGRTAKRLDMITIALVVFGVGFVLLERLVWSDHSSDPLPSQANSEQPVEAIAADEKKSIAVLPFANFSDDADNAFFASGVHEDILTHLAKIKDLRVISRTSVEQYTENRPPIREIAGVLGVKNIVEGSVRRAGNTVRVTAQLIDATTDEHLWAESFDRDLTDVFAIQTEIARQIVAALKATLTDDEAALIADRPTDNMEAYDLFLRAREILRGSDYSKQKYIEAEPVLTRAIELDPDFALAHALMVTIHGQAVWIGYDTSDLRKQAAKASAEKALQLNPDLPEAQAALAEYYYRIEQDFERSITELEAAHLRLPNDGDILHAMGMTFRRLGKWEESIASFNQAVELDPANLFNLNALCETLVMLRRWDEAIKRLDPILNEYPDQSGLAAIKARALLSGYGDIEGAKEAISGRPATSSFQYNTMKMTLPWVSRNYGEMISTLNEPAVKSFVDNPITDGWPQQVVGEAYLAMGNLEEARIHLESSRDRIGASLVKLDPNDISVPFLQSLLSRTLALMGEFEQAMAVADLSMLYEYDHVVKPYQHQTYAEVLARSGQVDRALDELAMAMESPNGPTTWDIALNPSWDFLRDNERFQAMTAVEPRIGVEKKP